MKRKCSACASKHCHPFICATVFHVQFRSFYVCMSAYVCCVLCRTVMPLAFEQTESQCNAHLNFIRWACYIKIHFCAGKFFSKQRKTNERKYQKLMQQIVANNEDVRIHFALQWLRGHCARVNHIVHMIFSEMLSLNSLYLSQQYIKATRMPLLNGRWRLWISVYLQYKYMTRTVNSMENSSYMNQLVSWNCFHIVIRRILHTDLTSLAR